MLRKEQAYYIGVMVEGPFRDPHKFLQHHAESRALRSHADWRRKCPSRALRSAADVRPRLASRCDRLTSKLPRRRPRWPGPPVSGLVTRERHEPQLQVQLTVSPLGTQTLDTMLSMRHLVLYRRATVGCNSREGSCTKYSTEQWCP